jgi:adenylate kinase
MDTPKAFIFFGPSGSGKGTQAKLLSEYLNKTDPAREVIYIETGGQAREFIKGDGFANKQAKEILANGGLFPEFLPIWLWADMLIKRYTGNEHLICDGLSRRLAEAPVLEGALKFFKFEKPYIVVMNVSREWTTARLLERGRNDDTVANINRRLDWYYENVVPAIDHFRKSDSCIVLDLNGEQPIETVHAELVSRITVTQ